MPSLLKNLIDIVGKHNVMMDKSLKEYTYTKLGGKADYLVMPKTYQEVKKVVDLSRDYHIPITTIGNGSNLIVRDGGIRGIVLSLANLKNIITYKDMITAQAGASIIDVSYEAFNQSLTGLEFACGIPGTVGAAVFMNAGAYGGEIKDVLEDILVIDQNGDWIRRPASELNLNYRYSIVQDNRDIILEARFKLKEGNKEEIRAIMDDLTRRRHSSQPLEYPSCGSVFKRPPGYYVGQLVRESKLQGVRIGGAEVSKKHAGFIVNVNDAKASDYIRLIEHVKKTVKENFNVELEPEVRIIGEEE